jgi:thiamine biosynthesis lipoprotein
MTATPTLATIEPRQVSFAALGTTATVLVASPDAAVLDAARRAVEAEVAAMDRAASRFRDDSELAGVNRAAGRAVPTSPLLLEAVEVALRAARLTAGLVDPTIGKALRLLGYDRDFGAVDPVGQPLHLQAEAVPGWHLVAVDRQAGTVRVPAGVELDLGSAAKALAADRAATAAVATGVGVLVSLGGDVGTAGPPPAGGWSIRVTDDHAAAASVPGQTITITGGGLATSGTTVRRWQRGEVVHHHIIDPATGQAAAPCWRTVSVAAATCVDANAASTAAIILGRRAPAWLEDLGLPARLVDVGGAVSTVGGWPQA